MGGLFEHIANLGGAIVAGAPLLFHALVSFDPIHYGRSFLFRQIEDLPNTVTKAISIF